MAAFKLIAAVGATALNDFFEPTADKLLGCCSQMQKGNHIVQCCIAAKKAVACSPRSEFRRAYDRVADKSALPQSKFPVQFAFAATHFSRAGFCHPQQRCYPSLGWLRTAFHARPSSRQGWERQMCLASRPLAKPSL